MSHVQIWESRLFETAGACGPDGELVGAQQPDTINRLFPPVKG